MTVIADIAEGAAQGAATKEQGRLAPARVFTPDDLTPPRATRGRRGGRRHGRRAEVERKITEELHDLYRTWEQLKSEHDDVRRDQLLRRVGYRRTAVTTLCRDHPVVVAQALAAAKHRRDFLAWFWEFADQDYARKERTPPWAPLARISAKGLNR